MDERLSAADAAAAIADERYPNADPVILTGSVSGRTHDLDLVIVSVKDDEAPFRESSGHTLAAM